MPTYRRGCMYVCTVVCVRLLVVLFADLHPPLTAVVKLPVTLRPMCIMSVRWIDMVGMHSTIITMRSREHLTLGYPLD